MMERNSGQKDLKVPISILGVGHFDWDLPGGVKLEELDMAEAYGITLRKKSILWLKAKPQ